MSPLSLSPRSLFCLLALLSSFSGGEMRAQEASVPPGTRVHLWTETDAKGRSSGEPIEGRLTGWTPDFLVVDYRSLNGPRTNSLTSVSAAVDQTSGPTQETGRWTITMYLGATLGGPAGDLEAAMVANGWNEPNGGCGMFGCWPESPNPRSSSFANPILLGVRYQLRSFYAAELMVGQALAGTTTGRRGDHLNIEHNSAMVAPLLSAGTRYVRGSVGPALLHTNWTYWEAADRGRDEQMTTFTPGWVGAVGAEIPIRSRFLLGFQGQYRGFGSTDLQSHRGAQKTFPAVSVSSSHRYFAAGLGVRI